MHWALFGIYIGSISVLIQYLADLTFVRVHQLCSVVFDIAIVIHLGCQVTKLYLCTPGLGSRRAILQIYLTMCSGSYTLIGPGPVCLIGGEHAAFIDLQLRCQTFILVLKLPFCGMQVILVNGVYSSSMVLGLYTGLHFFTLSLSRLLGVAWF